MADVNIKAKLSVDTTEADKGISNIKGNLKGASDTAKAGGADFSKLKDTIGQLGPAGDMATKQMGSLNQAFNLLKANPIILVFTVIAGLVYALFQKFKEMEAVSDALGKAFGTLSGVISAFMNKILTPLIDGFVKIVELTSKGVIFVLDKLGVTSQEAAERTGELIDQLDDLEDAERDSALAVADANLKLKQAREIASDANKPIAERVKALREAAKIEKEEADNVVRINLAKAKAEFELYANDHNARKETIALIRQGTVESLEAARVQLSADKSANKDKISEITKLLIAAKNAAAESSGIQRKTQKEITSLEHEEQAKREAQHKAYLEKKKKAEEEHNKAVEADRKTLADYEKARLAGLMKNAEEKTKQDEEKRKKEKEQADADFAQMEKDAEAVAVVGIESAKKYTASKEEIDLAHLEHKKAMQASEMTLLEQGVSLLQQLAGNNKTLQKAAVIAENAISIGKIVTSTNAANAAAIAKYSLIPGGQAIAAAEITMNKISAGIGIASNAIATAKALQAIGSGGSSSANGAAPAAITSPTTPITPQPGSMQLNTATIQGIGNAAAGGVNRAYVLDADVNNQSERQARLHRAARLA